MEICYNQIAIKNARVAKLADALDLGSSGQPWGFESLHAHQYSKKVLKSGLLFCLICK